MKLVRMALTAALTITTFTACSLAVEAPRPIGVGVWPGDAAAAAPPASFEICAAGVSAALDWLARHQGEDGA